MCVCVVHEMIEGQVPQVVSDSFATPWTVTHLTPVSMGFPRQEYWNGLPFPSPGVLPNPGIEPESPALQVDSLPLSHWPVLGTYRNEHSFRRATVLPGWGTGGNLLGKV